MFVIYIFNHTDVKNTLYVYVQPCFLFITFFVSTTTHKNNTTPNNKCCCNCLEPKYIFHNNSLLWDMYSFHYFYDRLENGSTRALNRYIRTTQLVWTSQRFLVTHSYVLKGIILSLYTHFSSFSFRNLND